MPSERVLVTGGAGFIGSHLVDLLLSRGQRVMVVDDLSTGRRDNLPLRHERLEFVHADLAEFLASGRCEGPFDAIYHLAAAVGVALVMRDPVGAIQTNVSHTAALLAFARARGTRPHGATTFIASSSEVYGKSDKVPFSEDDDVLYGPTTKRRWSYAMSKALDEHLALAHAQHHELPVVIARFFNTVGPRQVGEYGMVLPRFVRAALAGEDLVVHGDGAQSRCFCDVRDIVPAVVALMESPQALGRVFNLGSDQPITIMNLAQRVVSVLGSASRITRVPYDSAYAYGFEDLRRRQPDLRRVRAAIGFEPTTPLDQTIRDIAACESSSRRPIQIPAGGSAPSAGPARVGGSSSAAAQP